MSLEINVIETKQCYLQKEGVNQIMIRHKIGTQSDRKSQKQLPSPQNLSAMQRYGSTLHGYTLICHTTMYRNYITMLHLWLYDALTSDSISGGLQLAMLFCARTQVG